MFSGAMFRRIFLTGIVAGLVAGLALSVLQAFTTIPLILQAEAYEAAGGAHEDPAGTPAHDHAAPEWGPAEGLERSFYTALANVITAVGFGLLVSACLALHGRPADARRGVIWGLAGFAVFSLSPSTGLPPELPGSAAGDKYHRQPRRGRLHS